MWRWIYSLQQVRKTNKRWQMYYCTFIPNKFSIRVEIFFHLSFQGHHVILKVPNITPIVAYYPQWLYSCFLGTFNVQPYSLLIYYQIQSWDYSFIWLDVVQKPLNLWNKCIMLTYFQNSSSSEISCHAFSIWSIRIFHNWLHAKWAVLQCIYHWILWLWRDIWRGKWFMWMLTP